MLIKNKRLKNAKKTLPFCFATCKNGITTFDPLKLNIVAKTNAPIHNAESKLVVTLAFLLIL